MRVPITSIRENPSNPRKLDRAKFEKLVQSIRDFPEMLDKRPIIVADGIILGGNMRHKAAIQAGVNKVLQMTTEEGGLAYWPGGQEPTLWGSAYGGLMLLRARDQGQGQGGDPLA